LNKFKDPVASYLEKRGLDRSPFFKNFSSFREIVVVIPCFDEMENLPVVINSILKCDPPFDESFGFLFVINHPDNASYERKQESLKTVEYLKTVCSENGIPVALIDRFSEGFEVPAKFAGAGFPRKVGLDSALHLFDHTNSQKSLLVCLDADCEVAPSYFKTLKKLARRGCKAAVLEYEHRNDHPGNLDAISEYETWLRSYTAGLKKAGSPYAYHFIGSTMVCNVETYVKAGGMNTKRAAEDFYFLESLAKVAGIETIDEKLVFPSNRRSDRVIFGTGKAVNTRLDSGEIIKPYPDLIFDRLKKFLELFHHDFPTAEELIVAIQKSDEEVFNFLESYKFSSAMNGIYSSSRSSKQIARQKDVWFDALKTLRFVHHLSP
jgi:glycosyltransferase involved in cell wall biosynthesis